MHSHFHTELFTQIATTKTLLLEFSYMLCMRPACHSLMPSLRRAHKMTRLGTQSKAFFRSTKAMYSVLLTTWNVSCNRRTMNVASVVLHPSMKPNCIPSIRTCRRNFLCRSYMTWSSNLRPQWFLRARTHCPCRRIRWYSPPTRQGTSRSGWYHRLSQGSAKPIQYQRLSPGCVLHKLRGNRGSRTKIQINNFKHCPFPGKLLYQRLYNILKAKFPMALLKTYFGRLSSIPPWNIEV